MSSEVCPFCGKSYKRVKSHLPHCKAAPSSKTPPSVHDVPAGKTTHLSRTAAAKGKKSELTSSATAEPQAENVSSSWSLLTSPAASPSPPRSINKRKQKLADQIRTASSVLPPPASLSVSKPKKESLRASIEAAKSKQVTRGAPEGAASEDLPSHSPPSSRTAAQTENKTKPDKDRVVLFSAETTSEGAPKKKVSKSKRDALSFHATKQTSDSKEWDIRPQARVNFWVDSEGEPEDSSLSDFVFKPRGGSRAPLTLRDVKATLGRANGARPPVKSGVLSPVETADRLRPGAGVGGATRPSNDAVRAAALSSAQLLASSLHHTVSVKSNAPTSQQPSLVLLPPPPAAAGPPPSSSSSSARLPSPTTSQTSTLRGELKVSRHVTELLSTSPPLSCFSSPLHFPAAPALQLEVDKQNTAGSPTGASPGRSLGQVTLRELPEWLAVRTPSRPRDVVEMVHRGWRWYYRRYIDVKTGGVAGVGMLLAGYCVLSYIWSYPHTKLDRWRKYH